MFLVAVLTIISVVGSIMYFVEGPAGGFTSIPIGVYWAVVTLTTVGYGDIAPVTTVGRMLAAMVMILGYAIIAVPTGIVTAELTAQSRDRSFGRPCKSCGQRDTDGQGAFCRWCGTPLR